MTTKAPTPPPSNPHKYGGTGKPTGEEKPRPSPPPPPPPPKCGTMTLDITETTRFAEFRRLVERMEKAVDRLVDALDRASTEAQP